MSIHQDTWGVISPEEPEKWSQCCHCVHGRVLKDCQNELHYCRSLDEVVGLFDFYSIETKKNVCCNFEYE